MYPRHVIFALLAIAPALVVADDGPLFFRLSGETAHCIAENQLELRNQTGSVVFVYPPTCPIRPDNPLSVFTTAEAPNVGDHTVADDGKPDTLLVLGRSELDCFAALDLPDDASLWRFYPDSCRFEPEP